MKKLKLDVEGLAVESFETDAGLEDQGTVRGYWTERTAPLNDTCGAEVTCGPYTCRGLYCVIITDNWYDCGTGADTNACPAPTATCPPPSGQMSCVGCTTFNYTAAGDTCDFCASFYTDGPQHCPCI